MHPDPKVTSHFDAVLRALVDQGRAGGESTAWLPALVLMAVRMVCAITYPGHWLEYVGDARRRDFRYLSGFMLTVLHPMGSTSAAKRLTDMIFRADELVLSAWLVLVNRLDYENDADAFRAFADWFSERLDDPEAWGPTAYGVVVPPNLARLMVLLAGVKKGDHVLDPACGAGGLLAAAWNIASDAAGTDVNARPLETFGYDRNVDASAITRLRLFLLSIHYGQPDDGDSAHVWQSLPKPVDAVVSAPPAGTMYQRIDFELFRRWHQFPDRVSAEAAITMTALDRLVEGGQAALLIPKGLLFRAGDNAKLRRILNEDGAVSAVISLPAGILAPLTYIETAVLVLRKPKDGDNLTGVTMVDASDAGRRERRRVFLSEEECATIHKLVLGEPADAGPIRLRRVSVAMIEEAEFDLQPERYIERRHAGEQRSLEERREAVRMLDREYRDMVDETDALIERLMPRH